MAGTSTAGQGPAPSINIRSSGDHPPDQPPNPPLTLRPLRDADLPLVEVWMQLSHVRPWFRNPQEWLHEMRERRGEFAFLKHLIAEREGQRVGFCQYYHCLADELAWSEALPHRGTHSIDYLLGPTELLGRGIGRELVAALTARTFAQTDAKRIAVSPERENIPSRRTLLSCGYELREGELFVLTRERWRRG